MIPPPGIVQFTLQLTQLQESWSVAAEGAAEELLCVMSLLLGEISHVQGLACEKRSV